MKKTISLIIAAIIIVCFAGCTDYDSTNKNTDTPTKPITSIETDISAISLIVGETQNIKVSILPIDTDETVTYDIADNSIIEYANGIITAKGKGETTLTVKAATSYRQAVCRVRVYNDVAYQDFKNDNIHRLKNSTLKVFCKSYDTNFFGFETNVETIEGRGAIIKRAGMAYHFVTYKPIFDNANNRDYQKWYVEDYLGNQYDITGLQYHKTTSVAIGAFTSSVTSLFTLNVFGDYVYKGEYAYSLTGNPLVSKIESTDYNYFYHGTSISLKHLGDFVVNGDCELIGINCEYPNQNAKAISNRSVIELMNQIGI